MSIISQQIGRKNRVRRLQANKEEPEVGDQWTQKLWGFRISRQPWKQLGPAKCSDFTASFGKGIPNWKRGGGGKKLTSNWQVGMRSTSRKLHKYPCNWLQISMLRFAPQPISLYYNNGKQWREAISGEKRKTNIFDKPSIQKTIELVERNSRRYKLIGGYAKSMDYKNNYYVDDNVTIRSNPNQNSSNNFCANWQEDSKFMWKGIGQRLSRRVWREINWEDLSHLK